MHFNGQSPPLIFRSRRSRRVFYTEWVTLFFRSSVCQPHGTTSKTPCRLTVFSKTKSSPAVGILVREHTWPQSSTNSRPARQRDNNTLVCTYKKFKTRLHSFAPSGDIIIILCSIIVYTYIRYMYREHLNKTMTVPGATRTLHVPR